MVNKYDQKHNEKLRKKAFKNVKIFLKKKKKKGEKRPEKDIKVLLKKKKEKVVSIIRNVSRSYLGIKLFFI